MEMLSWKIFKKIKYFDDGNNCIDHNKNTMQWLTQDLLLNANRLPTEQITTSLCQITAAVPIISGSTGQNIIQYLVH